MKPWRHCLLVFVLGGQVASLAEAAKNNPIEKIVGLLTTLQGQLVSDEETESAAYKKYSTWCSSASSAKKEVVKQAKSEKDLLTAAIAKASSDIETATGKVEDASAGVAENEAKLVKAEGIRSNDASAFKGSETELRGSIDMLEKAIDILTKEMAKTGSAALLQTSAATQQLENVVMGLGAVIEGATLGASEDLTKLTAMLQIRQDAEDASDDLAEPEKKAYGGQSSGIIEVLGDLCDKAETQLKEIRKGEATAKQNFGLMAQALKDAKDLYQKEFDVETQAKAAAQKTKATADGNLAMKSRELAEGSDDYASVQRDCMRKATDHEASTVGRRAELKTLSEAKKIIQAQMGGAAAAALTQTDEVFSFLQMSETPRLSREQIAGGHVVALVQRLAMQQNSDSLKQLSSRISAVIRYGLNGSTRDPFKKVKGLLVDMIRKLAREQSGDASEAEYCDREMKKTAVNQEELTDNTEGFKTKVDQAASASTKIKSQVKDLQYELATNEKLAMEMSSARNDAHKVFSKEKSDVSQGLNAMRSAIHILRDFYAADKDDSLLQTKVEDTDSDEESDGDSEDQPAPPETHTKSGGAGAAIIGLLEVIESTMAKSLAELQTEEDDAQVAYDKEVQAGKISKAEKDQDISYNTKEYTSLDKSVTELSSDSSTTSEELSAVNEYFAKVKDRCVAKEPKYADLKAKRAREIKGLEEAKAILESESSSFLQRRK